MSPREFPVGIRIRIDLGPDSSIGPGKVALLEHIEASGSLSQAARDLGMSYRRAWLLLDDLNHAFTEPVATASVGGAGGGGARLTAFGRRIIEAYRAVEHTSLDAATNGLAWLVAGSVGPRPIKGIERRRLSREGLPRPPRRSVNRAPAAGGNEPGRRARGAKRS